MFVCLFQAVVNSLLTQLPKIRTPDKPKPRHVGSRELHNIAFELLLAHILLNVRFSCGMFTSNFQLLFLEIPTLEFIILSLSLSHNLSLSLSLSISLSLSPSP